MSEKIHYEIYWLRTISCLSVVLIHAISSGIYLLHKLFVDTIGPVTSNIYIHISTLFIMGIILPIIIMNIFNKIPYGKYITSQKNKVKIDISKSHTNPL